MVEALREQVALLALLAFLAHGEQAVQAVQAVQKEQVERVALRGRKAQQELLEQVVLEERVEWVDP